MIATREIGYAADGLTMVAHLARPDGAGPWPAVLVGHDGIGLEGYQRSRADELARRGYLALALDYHGGRTYFGEPAAMLDRVLPLLADPGRMRAVGRAGLDVLLAEPGADPARLGALGYGAGANVVLELARSGVPFRGVAAVHPGVPAADPVDPGGWAGVTAALLLCTGSADPICPPDRLLSLTRMLQSAGVDWRVHVYGGAEHAFWAEPRAVDGAPTGGTAHAAATVPGVSHHPAHAERAWRAVLDLLDETLAPARSRR